MGSIHAADPLYGNPAKALVMTHIGQIVRDGYARWATLDNRDVELRISSGEIFFAGGFER
jgi:hypothetical protein